MSTAKYVEVTLNGETKLLKYDFNAVSDIEEKFGKGITFIFDETQVGFNTLRVFYWAGLKWKEQAMTVQRAGQLLGESISSGEHTIESLMKYMLKALQKSKLIGSPHIQDENTIDAGDNEEPKNV